MCRHLALVSTVLLLTSVAACSDREPVPIPPTAPQASEVAVSGESDPVSEECASEGTLHKPGRVLVTRSPEWGTIWRADFTVPTDEASPRWRFVCWKDGRLLRPLEMPDPSQSIPPLP